jgi:predicted transcriptional regulator
MRRNEPIHHIMTSEVLSVHIGEKPSKVRQMLDDNPFQHVPVLNGKKLVGIVSAKDWAKLSLDAYVHDKRAVDAHLDAEFTLEGLMTPDPESINDHATVR